MLLPPCDDALDLLLEFGHSLHKFNNLSFVVLVTFLQQNDQNNFPYVISLPETPRGIRKTHQCTLIRWVTPG